MKPQRKAPAHQHRGHAKATARSLYRLPADWRERLPDPAAYYRQQVDKLGKPNASGWAQGRCPFHEDTEASLSVNIQHGGWRCFAGCGKGDLVVFHQHLTGKRFKDAVRDLLGVGQ